MTPRPQNGDRPELTFNAVEALLAQPKRTALVLSGGGTRAAYQIGALKALLPFFGDRKVDNISVIVGSSIGAINGLMLGACLKCGLSDAVNQIEALWRVRNFRNSFSGTPSQAFLRAVKMAVMQYLSPGPKATQAAIFDPTPMMREVDLIIERNGGLAPEQRAPSLKAVSVMTTIEGATRKPLLFLSAHKPLTLGELDGASFEVCNVRTLSAKHGFASAALPSVLPPVEIDVEGGNVKLVDGGISQNVPVDPAVRLGAERVIVLDVSGRDWWLNRDNEPQDTRPTWEVLAAPQTYCLRQPETFVFRCRTGLGGLLKESVASSHMKFMAALGPVWPVFSLLKRKLGEDIAYEAMTYVALDPDYIEGLIELGYNETLYLLHKKGEISFALNESYGEWLKTF